MLNLVLALLAGVVTVAAPCTLPVLPILLGASVGQTGKARPAMIALGFVTSFHCRFVAERDHPHFRFRSQCAADRRGHSVARIWTIDDLAGAVRTAVDPRQWADQHHFGW